MRSVEIFGAIALLGLGAACTEPPATAASAVASAPTANAPPSPEALSGAPTLEVDPRFRYEVTATAGAAELLVEAAFPAGGSETLRIDRDLESFVSDLTVYEDRAWKTVPAVGATWQAPCRQGCRLRYRFRLREAARAIDSDGWAAERAGAIFSPPSTWLIHPSSAPAGARYALRVKMPEGWSFATGLFLSDDGFGYEAPVAELPLAPFSVFGALEVRRVRVGDTSLEVAIAPGAFDVGYPAIDKWVGEAARDVTELYGVFPVPRAAVLLIPTDGDAVGFSRALGYGGASILSPVGSRVSTEELAGDWQMTHEMLHLGFPNLGDDHAWLEEGIATYVEPILRVRRGRLDERRLWRQFARNMPLGQPQAGDQGLDLTPTWGRTYWGGALFCLVADVEIRRRSEGKKTFDDALRAVAAAGGNVGVRWSIDEVIRVGDEATELDVLSTLYARHRTAAVPFDLEPLLAELGVSRRGREIEISDVAPLAAIRRAIGQPRK